jgi:APA family basic amino acid/polyamine antiporter
MSIRRLIPGGIGAAAGGYFLDNMGNTVPSSNQQSGLINDNVRRVTVELRRQLGLFTGVLVIIADMIGTGIFMTTGNILGMTGNALTVLVLWGVGGLVAVTGALCYAELAAMWPDVGGEYVYLKRSFGFLPAFLTGWVSLVVGFSAPVATSSLLLVEYLGRFWHATAGQGHPLYSLFDGFWVQKGIATALVVFFAALHITGVKRGGYLQNVLTLLKVLIVGALIVFGLAAADWGEAGRLAARYSGVASQGAAGIPSLGLALLIIMFAYSGWNCASYIAGEVKDPGRTLPRALLAGTLITTVLYLLLNVVFLVAAPGGEIMGKDEVGAIAAARLFGPWVSGFFTLGIALILLSAVSAQMMVGPRVSYAMSKDNMIFRFLSGVHPRFVTPAPAILVQLALAVFYIFTGSAMTLVIYMGFALNVFPVMAVIGLMHMRRRRPDIPRPYRVPLYPLTPLVYVLLSCAMMAAALMSWTKTSLFAIGVLAAGVPVFYIWRRFAGAKGGD